MKKQIRTASACIAVAAAIAGCSGGDPVLGAEGGNATPYGYWEGDGTASEKLMDDPFRKLTRTVEFEFWFALNADGEAFGEIELKYDAELIVDGLPNVTVPVPGGSSVSFQPKVGGKMTDLDPTRTFPLVGVLDGESLTLMIATPEENRKTLDFTIRGDAGVSGTMALGAGKDGGGGDASIGAGGDAQLVVIEIDMTPFSPFNGAAMVEKRPGGPYAARFEENADKYSIEWSARQIGGEQRQKLEMTPEMELELRRLKEQLGLD